MAVPNMLVAMGNGAIEVASQVEPLMSDGVAQGIHQVLVQSHQMHPTAQSLYLMYWAAIDRLGLQVGERFMVAFLRGRPLFEDKYRNAALQYLGEYRPPQ